MGISYKRLTIATDTAVTLNEALKHLRLIITDADAEAIDASEKAKVTALIKTAEQYCESYCRRCLVVTDWMGYLDKFPADGLLNIQKSPLVSISEIKYFDTDGAEQTLDTKYYDADVISEPARIKFKTPPATADKLNAVSIKFTAGYAGADGKFDTTLIPKTIKQAMLLIIGHLYEHREEVIVGVQQSEIDFGVDRLLDTERLFMF
jgi:uncharacterized phiE125 gp8 family phage protein